MDFRAIRRAIVALTAAYSMALQASLLAFVAPQVAALAEPLTVLCSTFGSGDDSAPAKHEIPCPAVCAAMGHGLTGALPAGIAAVALLHEAYVAVASWAGWIAPLLFAAGPQQPRGPPAA